MNLGRLTVRKLANNAKSAQQGKGNANNPKVSMREAGGDSLIKKNQRKMISHLEACPKYGHAFVVLLSKK